MSLTLNITSQELRATVIELDQSLYNHQQWYNVLIRSLICRLPADRHNLLTDAHKECLFGQWYYGDSIPKKIREHLGFVAIGEAHQRMHENAARLLTITSEGGNINTVDYDSFANMLERLRLEILALKNELENLLYNHDPLTMAINRVSMLPILREQQDLIKRQNQPCCIGMMDLDNFKEINDHYGHTAGDAILTAVAQYLRKALRTYDRIFRYGGEEFLICMQQTALKSGFRKFENLCKGLSDLSIDVGLKQRIHVTTSIGVALIDPDIPVEQSIDHADKALYAAKEAGKNCVRLWEPASAMGG